MAIIASCPSCNARFPSVFQPAGPYTGVVHVEGNRESCPNCGRIVKSPEGKFDLVHGLVRSVASAGLSRAEINAAKRVADRAAHGSISTTEALAEMRGVAPNLAAVIEREPDLKIDWGLLVALLALIYAIFAGHSSDQAASDALAEARKQTEVAEKILATLEAPKETEPASGPTPQKLLKPQSKTSGMKNRAQRRKDAAIARRKKPPLD